MWNVKGAYNEKALRETRERKGSSAAQCIAETQPDKGPQPIDRPPAASLGGWGSHHQDYQRFPTAARLDLAICDPCAHHPLASTFACDEPSIPRAWEAFRAHLPTMVVLWLAVITLSGMGLAVSFLAQFIIGGMLGLSSNGAEASPFLEVFGQVAQMPFALVSSLVSVLFFSVPARYYDSGEVITPGQAVSQLMQDPIRYLLAGALFNLVLVIGLFFCLLPGLLVNCVMPIYVNRIFLTKQPILEAFSGSFQAVYRSPNGWSFVGLQILALILVVLASICTCGLGTLVVFPMSAFYIQNAAYHKGLIR